MCVCQPYRRMRTIGSCPCRKRLNLCQNAGWVGLLLSTSYHGANGCFILLQLGGLIENFSVSECVHIVLVAVIVRESPATLEFQTTDLLTVAPVENCELIFGMAGTFSTMSIASTSYLFLIRVRTVYLNSRRITIVFGSCWLVTIALVILASASTRVG